MRILIADDHPLYRDALRYVIERLYPHAEVVEASGYLECLSLTRVGAPFDLICVDLMMPGGGESLDALRRLRAQAPATPIVVISSREDWPMIRRVAALGVAAYVPKSTPKPDLEATLRAALAGEVRLPEEALPEVRELAREAGPGEPLTPRQAAVLEQLARGSSNRQIAIDLNIEEITVKAHISAILRKLHVKNRLEAVVATRQ